MAESVKPSAPEMSFEEQQAVLKEVLSRKPSCKFDETQPGFKTFLCPVCLDVFKNPVDHTCGNTFCSECVKSVSSCPMCRKQSSADDYKPASLIIKNTILSLKVVCGTCKKTMTYDEFNTSHDKNCSFSCPFRCGEQVNRTTFEKHCKDGKCKNYLLSCPASEPPLLCKWHGHGGPEYDEHVSKCVLIPLIPFATYMKTSIATIHERLCKKDGHCFEGDATQCKYCGARREVAEEKPVPAPKINQYSLSREQLVGHQVRRGRDWKWGSQDGGKGSTGKVVRLDSVGWVRVEWSNGDANNYRWGDGGCYDLEVIDL